MRRKRLIVSCLLPAYLLLVLHAIIPHHHHFAAHDAPVPFHHGFNTHHEPMTMDHSHDHEHNHAHDKDHGHTAHFVHSPEFGNAMIRPNVHWIDITFQNSLSAIFEHRGAEYRNTSHDTVSAYFPERPPHYISPTFASTSLRGPPSYILI